MNSVDYTPVILAQLTDLQMRVTKQDTTIASLKAEVERLTGRSSGTTSMTSGADPSTMRTSVPLRPNASEYSPRYDNRGTGSGTGSGTRSGHGAPGGRNDRPLRNFVPSTSTGCADNENRPTGMRRARPQVATGSATGDRPTMTLADVLVKDEIVTLQVGTGKDAEGKFTNTTALATFDGTELTITECALTPSIIGMKSAKPGEILYAFIQELYNSGQIKKTFAIAPWKLCFVERNGIKKSLEELRSTVA